MKKIIIVLIVLSQNICYSQSICLEDFIGVQTLKMLNKWVDDAIKRDKRKKYYKGKEYRDEKKLYTIAANQKEIDIICVDDYNLGMSFCDTTHYPNLNLLVFSSPEKVSEYFKKRNKKYRYYKISIGYDIRSDSIFAKVTIGQNLIGYNYGKKATRYTLNIFIFPFTYLFLYNEKLNQWYLEKEFIR